MITFTRFLSLLLLFGLASCCKTPVQGINPTSSVNSAGGDNNTVASESWYNSVKTVATVNLSGSAGALVIFSIILLLVIAVYKKLSDFLHLVNNRLHNLAALFGIQGFAYSQPAVTHSSDTENQKNLLPRLD